MPAMATPTSIARASRPLPLPPNGTSVSARAIPMDTAVNATTSDNTSAAVRTNQRHIRKRMTPTRTLDQFLGHGPNPRVRITLVTNMAGEAGRGSGRNKAAILANRGECVAHG